MESLSIIHEKNLTIDKDYQQVKSNIQENLSEWSDLFVFDDKNNQIRYKTEGPLIPEDNSRIPVLILLSNPHPHSVKQGMFLSPNRIGRENPFWETLKGTGYFDYNGQIDAEVMIRNRYKSPFRFFMAVLLPFPSEDPSHLKELLGYNAYRKMYDQGRDSIHSMIMDHKIKNIICFGGLQYDAIAIGGSPNNYTSILSQGMIVKDTTKSHTSTYVYLTFPTGWRYVKNFKVIKVKNFKNILTYCQER